MNKETQTEFSFYDEVDVLNEKVNICYQILNRIQSNSFYIQNEYITEQLIRTIRQNLRFPAEALSSSSFCNKT